MKAPQGTERQSHVQVTWRDQTAQTEQQPDPGTLSLYLKPVSDPTRGYGQSLADVLANDGASPARHAAALLHSVLNAATIEEQHAAWHTHYRSTIGTRYAQLLHQGLTQEQASRRAAEDALRIPFGEDARLLASVDCGIGMIFFVVDTGPNGETRLLDVAMVRQNGRWVLADNFLVLGQHEGLSYQLFWSEPFKRALLDYLQKTQPQLIGSLF